MTEQVKPEDVARELLRIPDDGKFSEAVAILRRALAQERRAAIYETLSILDEHFAREGHGYAADKMRETIERLMEPGEKP